MKSIALMILLPFLFIACTKEKNERQACSISANNIAGKYKVTAVTYKLNPGDQEQDYFNEFFESDCEKDDIVTFNANGTYLVDDVGSVCTPSGEAGGYWVINGNKIIIEDISVIDGEEGTIDEFNCSKLVIMYRDFDADNDQVKITLTRQ